MISFWIAGEAAPFTMRNSICGTALSVASVIVPVVLCCELAIPSAPGVVFREPRDLVALHSFDGRGDGRILHHSFFGDHPHTAAHGLDDASNNPEVWPTEFLPGARWSRPSRSSPNPGSMT